MVDSRPIGVFDSGIGGLTVFKELALRLPDESFVYFGDTARVPYGSRSKDTIIKYTFQCVRFLLSNNVKAIVIACNTASATALPSLKDAFDIPIIGVIEPGAYAAVRANKNGTIGIIGTQATIRSGAYSAAIHKIDASKSIVSNPCPLFVPLVEEGWAGTEVARLTAAEYLKPIIAGGADTVIMGCTHYPLLRGVVAQTIGDGVTLIDPAEETAVEFEMILERNSLKGKKDSHPGYSYFVSDDPERFVKVGTAFLGRDIENIEKIDIDNC